MVATEVGDTKHWAKRGGAIAVFLVVCGLTLGAVKVVTISRNVFEQERCLHAMILAARVVEDYVTNFDQWPRSWDDLKKVLPQDWGPYGWPGDSDDIATLVNIDFDYDLGQIETSSISDFNALRPVGQCHVLYRDYAIHPLWEFLRSRNRAAQPNVGQEPIGRDDAAENQKSDDGACADETRGTGETQGRSGLIWSVPRAQWRGCGVVPLRYGRCISVEQGKSSEQRNNSVQSPGSHYERTDHTLVKSA